MPRTKKPGMGRDVIEDSELLYLTSDPNETPLVMPTWARSVPDLAARIDAGYELHRRGHELAAERGVAVRCPISHGGEDEPDAAH